MNQAATVSQDSTVSYRLFITLISLIWLLIACTGSNQPVNSDRKDSAVTPMRFSAPGGEALLRAVNIETVKARIAWMLIDGTDGNGPINMNRNVGGEVWESPPITLKRGASYNISITWSATGVDGVEVDYATQEYSYTGTSESEQIDLSGQAYNFERFDEDNDGLNNYEELLAGTELVTADSCDGQGGSDPGSTNDLWNDNCSILYDISSSVNGVQKSPFYESTYVKGIQRILYCQGYGTEGIPYTSFVDGLYGPWSETAVREYQADKGLLVDGNIGMETWGALQMDVENSDTLISANSDNKYRAYGIRPSNKSALREIDDCSQVTHFFHRFNNPPETAGWELASTPGENVKSSFSIAEPQ